MFQLSIFKNVSDGEPVMEKEPLYKVGYPGVPAVAGANWALAISAEVNGRPWGKDGDVTIGTGYRGTSCECDW